MPKYLVVHQTTKSTNFLTADTEGRFKNQYGFEKNEELRYYFQPLLSKAIKFESLRDVERIKRKATVSVTILEMV